jgi:hypothetical protein
MTLIEEIVIPAQAGIQINDLDPGLCTSSGRFRRGDEESPYDFFSSPGPSERSSGKARANAA